MTNVFRPPTPEACARVRAIAERTLTADEVERGLKARLTPDGIAEAHELVRWFLRRYPAPRERLAYVRRAYARWSSTMPR